MITLTFETLDS